VAPKGKAQNFSQKVKAKMKESSTFRWQLLPVAFAIKTLPAAATISQTINSLIRFPCHMLTLSEKLALSLPQKNFSPLPHNKQTKKAQKKGETLNCCRLSGVGA